MGRGRQVKFRPSKGEFRVCQSTRDPGVRLIRFLRRLGVWKKGTAENKMSSWRKFREWGWTWLRKDAGRQRVTFIQFASYILQLAEQDVHKCQVYNDIRAITDVLLFLGNLKMGTAPDEQLKMLRRFVSLQTKGVSPRKALPVSADAFLNANMSSDLGRLARTWLALGCRHASLVAIKEHHFEMTRMTVRTGVAMIKREVDVPTWYIIRMKSESGLLTGNRAYIGCACTPEWGDEWCVLCNPEENLAKPPYNPLLVRFVVEALKASERMKISLHSMRRTIIIALNIMMMNPDFSRRYPNFCWQVVNAHLFWSMNSPQSTESGYGCGYRSYAHWPMPSVAHLPWATKNKDFLKFLFGMKEAVETSGLPKSSVMMDSTGFETDTDSEPEGPKSDSGTEPEMGKNKLRQLVPRVSKKKLKKYIVIQ